MQRPQGQCEIKDRPIVEGGGKCSMARCSLNQSTTAQAAEPEGGPA